MPTPPITAPFTLELDAPALAVDLDQVAAGQGALTAKLVGLLAGDSLQQMSFTAAPASGGAAVVTKTIDYTARTDGQLSAIPLNALAAKAAFSFLPADVDAIRAAGPCVYAVRAWVLRAGVTVYHDVMAGRITAAANPTTVTALLRVASVMITGNPSGAPGGTSQLTATVKDSQGNTVVLPVTWTSSNPMVASVDANGLVSQIAPGTAAITATCQGIASLVMATVTDPGFTNPANGAAPIFRVGRGWAPETSAIDTLASVASADESATGNLFAIFDVANSVLRSIGLARLAGVIARQFNIFIITDPKYGAVPDSGTTDNTGPINLALADAMAVGGTAFVPSATGYYACKGGVLNLNNAANVRLAGASKGSATGGSRIIYTGGNQARFIDARLCDGLEIANLSILYNSPLFAGILIDPSGTFADNATDFRLTNSYVGSTNNALANGASCLLYLNGCYGYRVVNTQLQGAVDLVLGPPVDFTGSSDNFANGITFDGCLFADYTHAAVRNTDEAWSFEGTCIFEPIYGSGQPRAFTWDVGKHAFGLKLSAPWFGDATGAAGAWIEFRGYGLAIEGGFCGIGNQAFIQPLEAVFGISIKGTRFFTGSPASVFDFDTAGVAATSFGIDASGSRLNNNGAVWFKNGAIPPGTLYHDTNGQLKLFGTQTLPVLFASYVQFSGLTSFRGAATTDNMIWFQLLTEAYNRFSVSAGGILSWGDGASPADVGLARSTTQTLATTNSTRFSSSGLMQPINTRTASRTLTRADFTELGDATAGAIVFTLPSAASALNQMYRIKKIDASANTVTIDPNGAELIDGAATYVLSAQNKGVEIHCNGTGWFITAAV